MVTKIKTFFFGGLRFLFSSSRLLLFLLFLPLVKKVPKEWPRNKVITKSLNLVTRTSLAWRRSGASGADGRVIRAAIAIVRAFRVALAFQILIVANPTPKGCQFVCEV